MKDGVHNGQIWESGNGKAFILYLSDGDKWILVGTPDESASNGTCSIPFSGAFGQYIYTKTELELKLTLEEWELDDKSFLTLATYQKGYDDNPVLCPYVDETKLNVEASNDNEV